MIEFKGECGHTIRARDEDAGKIVRCSYCGREALVTREAHDELEGLFNEVEQTGVYDSRTTRAGQKAYKEHGKAQKRAAAGKPPKPALDPFKVAVKMVYVAVIIIAIAAICKWVPDLYNKLKTPDKKPPITRNTEDTTANSGKPKNKREGLIGKKLNPHQEGVYINSVPAEAMVFALPGHGKYETIISDPNSRREKQTPTEIRLTPGEYTIAVALRINEPQLKDLPDYQDTVRQMVESKEFDDQEKLRCVLDYFVPDESRATKIVEYRRSLYIAKVFEVKVEPKMWTAITPLFLPRKSSISSLIIDGHLPKRNLFAFDAEVIQDELDYYGVPESDQKYVMDMLKKTGKSYWMNEENRYRIFHIDLTDGNLISVELN